MLYDYPHAAAAVNTAPLSLFGFHPTLLPLSSPYRRKTSERENPFLILLIPVFVLVWLRAVYSY